MVSLYFESSTSIILTLKSTPIVAETWSGSNQVSSVKRSRILDFPVPLSPMRRSLKVALTSSGLITSLAISMFEIGL